MSLSLKEGKYPPGKPLDHQSPSSQPSPCSCRITSCQQLHRCRIPTCRMLRSAPNPCHSHGCCGWTKLLPGEPDFLQFPLLAHPCGCKRSCGLECGAEALQERNVLKDGKILGICVWSEHLMRGVESLCRQQDGVARALLIQWAPGAGSSCGVCSPSKSAACIPGGKAGARPQRG